MPHDVFISHSTLDKVFADTVCAKLERRGIRCWIAPRDIVPGASWPKSIAAAVQTCEIMVLVFSSSALASEPVESEITLAGDYRKVIIPVRIEDVDPTEGFKYLLAKVHWLDAITEPVERQLEQLARMIMDLLKTGVITSEHATRPGDRSRQSQMTNSVRQAAPDVQRPAALPFIQRPVFLSQSSKLPVILVCSIICALLEILYFQFTTPGIIPGLVGLGFDIAAAALTTLYCMWLYESYKNLRALGIDYLSTSPGGAVASNFIPVVSLVRPMFVFLELMRKSGPAGSSSNALLVVIWWLWRLVDYAVWANAWVQAIQSNFKPGLSIFHEIAFAYVPDLVLSYVVVAIIDKRQEAQERTLKENELISYEAGVSPR